MKLLKHFLLIGGMFTALSSIQAQETPPLKQRGNSTFQAVDDYLIAVKRLGIPTGTQDDLNAVVAAPNTAKIMYRTDINTLRVYNPVTGLWSNAVPSIDESVLLHTTGNETKTGNLQLNGNLNADGNISSVDGSIRSYRYSNGLGISVLPEFIKFKTDAGNLNYEGRLQAPSISDNRDWYLPDTSGVIAVGNFIKASPLNPQDANINISGSLYVKGKDDIFLNFDPANEIAPNPFTIKIGDTDTGIHWYGDGDISMRGNGNDIFRFSPGNVLYLPVTPNTATSDYSLLTRDNSTGWVKQIEPDALGMIKASPATPQNATIDIEGSGTFRGPINLLSGYNGGKSIFFGGDQLYYNEGWGLTWGRSIHTASLDITDEPGVAHSDFTVLVRDNASGTVKKIELADLKAMLEAL